MLNKLVFENFRHRPVRTVLSMLAIGIQVTMLLTLVGLSHGMLDDQKLRTHAVGADILVRAPGSSIIAFSTNFDERYLPFIAKFQHVVLATPTLVQPFGGVNSITGIDYDSFSKMSGGFRFLEGGGFRQADDVLIDDYYARQNKLHAGDKVNILNRPWHVAGVFEAGKLARVLVPLRLLQFLTANTGKVTVIYVKLDNRANTPQVISALKQKLPDHPIYSMEDFLSLLSVNNVPMLKQFIGVIIGLGVLVGFLVVFLSMYTAVLERTREIGVLKALGASPGYIISLLLRETALLAAAGSIVGILLSYGSRWLIQTLVPGSLIQAIVPEWWPIAAGIAIAGAMLGAIYPGLKAARQDAIEALAYD